jgi:hypothetical protein
MGRQVTKQRPVKNKPEIAVEHWPIERCSESSLLIAGQKCDTARVSSQTWGRKMIWPFF